MSTVTLTNPTPGYWSGFSSVFTPFSVNATPTSLYNSSGLFGSGVALSGYAAPPPDITGNTYGDYSTPNYNVAQYAPVPGAVISPNTNNPGAPTNKTREYYIIGGVLAVLVVGGLWFDRLKKGRKK